jgi:hypothetical protein
LEKERKILEKETKKKEKELERETRKKAKIKPWVLPNAKKTVKNKKSLDGNLGK